MVDPVEAGYWYNQGELKSKNSGRGRVGVATRDAGASRERQLALCDQGSGKLGNGRSATVWRPMLSHDVRPPALLREPPVWGSLSVAFNISLHVHLTSDTVGTM